MDGILSHTAPISEVIFTSVVYFVEDKEIHTCSTIVSISNPTFEDVHCMCLVTGGGGGNFRFYEVSTNSCIVILTSVNPEASVII